MVCFDYRCSHGDKAGQELCYLCHQRTQKNVPIYFAEERRQRELEQDRILQQYQQQKDTEAVLQEQVCRNLTCTLLLSVSGFTVLFFLNHFLSTHFLYLPLS